MQNPAHQSAQSKSYPAPSKRPNPNHHHQQANRASSSSHNGIQQRSNKHAPIEISSKKPVTRKRTIVEAPKIERRDPRFDSLSGAVNEELHSKSFGFLKEERRKEIEQLRETITKVKKSKQKSNLDVVEELEHELRRQENKEVQREKMEREKHALRKWKAEEKEKRKEGKGAFFLKRKAQKEIILTDRYQHLSQNKSKLHKSIERKRKKLDGKDKKSMPLKRTRPAEA
ncbi:hypothetical protein PCANC_19096 [Puccinia coronata f. sp. avenae]|uniref:rRNA biogenesis protein RRP36 n=1 Tax=Puccinia coronata f. sp. avenae TaxID=200324 RepID=A0A2N5SSD6_9BASI|nr:hypothetical protein PCANC_19096 [Puccinia coronata f. sp. avenae]